MTIRSLILAILLALAGLFVLWETATAECTRVSAGSLQADPPAFHAGLRSPSVPAHSDPF